LEFRRVYFIDPADAPYPTLLGTAYTGIDPMNREAAGDAAVFVRAFKPGNPADVELDAETVVHEVGHLLGLRHIDPPGTMAIMDYDEVSGDFELFTDRPFPIKEKPKAGGTEFGVTHNPLYHLRRYVDG